MDPALCASASEEGKESVCEVGDLSGKHGAFTAAAVELSVADNTVKLFGERSVAGRSIVLHRSDGSRWLCAPLAHAQPVRVASARFGSNTTGTIVGTVTFSQPADDPAAETTVLVDLRHENASWATSGHQWHVHVAPPAAGDSSCSSTGGHYNPTK